MNTLFVYGTLLDPDLLKRLLGRIPDSAPADLGHHARYTVTGEPYPGLVPEPGTTTSGALLFGLSPTELSRLDAYESDLYDRRTVVTRTVDGQTCTAYAYVVPRQNRHLLSDQPWEPTRTLFQTETN